MRTKNKLSLLNLHNDAETGNRTWATLVGSKCSHHFVISAPHETHLEWLSVTVIFLMLRLTGYCYLSGNKISAKDILPEN